MRLICKETEMKFYQTYFSIQYFRPILLVLLTLLLIGCSAAASDAVSDFLSGCNSGDFNQAYPQSDRINCHLNLGNGLKVDGLTQSTVGVQFSPSGESLYTLSSGLEAWNPESGEEIAVCPLANEALCHGADYQKLYYSAESGIIGVKYNAQIYAGPVQGESPLFISSLPHGEGPYPVRTAYIPGWEAFAVYNDTTVEFYSGKTGELLSSGEEPLVVEFIVGGQRFYATGYQNNLVLLLPTRLDGEGVLLEGHQARLVNGAFSPDNRRFASIDVDGNLFVWHTDDGSLLHQVQLDVGILEHAGFILSPPEIDISDDNELLVINRKEGNLTFVSLLSGEIVAETEMSRSIRDLDIAPDRSQLAIAYVAKQTTRTVDNRTAKERQNNTRRSEIREETVVSRGPAVLLDISGIEP